MNLFTSLGRGLGRFLAAPSDLNASAALASLPVAEVALPSGPALAAPSGIRPIASRPAIRPLPTPAESMARVELKPRYSQGDTIASLVEKHVAQALGSPLVAKAAAARVAKAKAAPSYPPQLADEDAPDADDGEDDPSLDSLVEQVQEMLELVKKRVKATPTDDADESAAKALFKCGKKRSAGKLFSIVAKRLCARAIEAEKKLTPQAKARLAFEEQPQVAAFIATMKPPVSRKAGSAPAAKWQEIDNAIKANEVVGFKTGYSAEYFAKHRALAAEREACRKQIQAK